LLLLLAVVVAGGDLVACGCFMLLVDAECVL